MNFSPKLCPVSNRAGSCITEACAWWDEEAGKCAIAAIPAALRAVASDIDGAGCGVADTITDLRTELADFNDKT